MRCRINSINKRCAYNPGGISHIKILDREDLRYIAFLHDGLYENNLITNVIRKEKFTDIPASDTAKYTKTLQGKLYTHTLETFAENLDYRTIRDLDLAKLKKYVVVYRTNVGKYYLFGYNPGASLSYSAQTEEGSGVLIRLTETTEYPLFEGDGDITRQRIKVLGTEDKRLVITEDKQSLIKIKGEPLYFSKNT